VVGPEGRCFRETSLRGTQPRYSSPKPTARCAHAAHTACANLEGATGHVIGGPPRGDSSRKNLPSGRSTQPRPNLLAISCCMKMTEVGRRIFPNGAVMKMANMCIPWMMLVFVPCSSPQSCTQQTTCHPCKHAQPNLSFHSTMPYSQLHNHRRRMRALPAPAPLSYATTD
jgi:hypothetical protein